MELKGKIFLLSLFLLISLVILSTGNAAWQDPLSLRGRVTATWEEEIVPEVLLLMDELALEAPTEELLDSIDPDQLPEDQDGADGLDPTAKPSEDDRTGGDAGDEKDIPADDSKEEDDEQDPGETKADHKPPTDESEIATPPSADKPDPASDTDGATEDDKDVPAEDGEEEGEQGPEGDTGGATEDEEKDVPANEEKKESEPDPQVDKGVPAPVDVALPDPNGSSHGDDESSVGSNEDAHD